MAEDKPLKSAYELAMERLNRADAEAGVETRRVTDEQKAAIADVRRFYEAKLAEQELLHKSTLRRTLEFEARAQLEEDYRRDRERLIAERDAKLERIRRGDPSDP